MSERQHANGASTAGSYGFTTVEVRAILATVVAALLLIGARAVNDRAVAEVPRWVTEETALQAESRGAEKPRLSPQGNEEIGALIDERVNVNEATRDDLMRLPGIGPKLADRIIDYRASEGVFQSIADLKNVRGIGAKKLAAIAGAIAVPSAPKPNPDSESTQP